MNNQPEDHELFVLPPGKNKVEFTEDKKIPNAGNFEIFLEDHTLGNLIKNQVQSNPEVKFVGYKKPHPLQNKIDIKIQTNAKSKPVDVLNTAIHNLTLNINSMGYKFQEEFEKYQKNKL